ncbi:MAG: class I SAM-dependent methyltransferase, partial [Micromonosporaceae bacterium]
MGSDERRLRAMWPFVRSHLPGPEASVLEIGCGPLGGFVPMLLNEGHRAVGVDPKAPDGEPYHQVEFERHDVSAPVDVVVASTSLHHVADIGDVLDRVAMALNPGGVVIVVEWASERFDEPTARWCFDRLPALGPEEEPGWLRRHHDRWRDSGESWDTYFQGWRREEGLHGSEAVLGELDSRFDRTV